MFIDRLSSTFLLSVIFCLLAHGQSNTQASISLKGHLSVVWGDFQDGQPAETHISVKASATGELYRVEVSAASPVLKKIYQWNGHEVQLRGRLSASKTASGPSIHLEHIQGPTGKREGLPANLKYLSVLLKFADDGAEPQDLAYFQRMYGNEPGQMQHFWHENAFGKLAVDGDVMGWLTLPGDRADYVRSRANINKLLDDAIDLLRETVDLNPYDGVNLMFNRELDGAAYGGIAAITWEGATRDLRVTWNPPAAYQNIGLLLHGMGHSFGLPDSNNSDRDADRTDNRWDLMSASLASSLTSEFGIWGQHINGYHKDLLGWLDESQKTTIDAPGTYTIHLENLAEATSDTTKLIWLESCQRNARVATSIEARGFYGYDQGLGEPSVVIHQIYERRSVPAWQWAAGPQDEGRDWTVGETYVDPFTGISVTLDGQTDTGFQLTLTLAAPAPDMAQINIPDPNFKAYLVNNFDCNEDGEINSFEAASVFRLNLPSGLNDLTGIEHFYNIDNLNCRGYNLAALPDLSNLVHLTTLMADGNQIQEIKGLHASPDFNGCPWKTIK